MIQFCIKMVVYKLSLSCPLKLNILLIESKLKIRKIRLHDKLSFNQVSSFKHTLSLCLNSIVVIISVCLSNMFHKGYYL